MLEYGLIRFGDGAMLISMDADYNINIIVSLFPLANDEIGVLGEDGIAFIITPPKETK